MRSSCERVLVKLPADRLAALEAVRGDLMYAGAIRELVSAEGTELSVDVTLAEDDE